MEVTLNQKDLESLADIVGKKINRDMVNVHVSNESHDQMKKFASAYASIYINDSNFKADLRELFSNMLKAEGSKLLREIVQGAMKDVLVSEKELMQLARKTIAQAAMEEANKVAERLNSFDDEE